MKLDKAIEILTIHNDHNPNLTDAERNQAHQLGIEALKYVNRLRAFSIQARQARLPGEDSFIDTSRSEHHIKELLESPLGREPSP